MTPPEWKRVEPLCWFNWTNKWGGGGKEKEKKLTYPSLPSSGENNMGAKLLKENATATQASRIMQNEEHRGKKVIKYVWSAKLHLKVASFLCFRCILRERWPVGSYRHCQALETVFVIFFFFFNKTVLMLMRKTLRWHAVVHVRTKGVIRFLTWQTSRRSWPNAPA